MAFREGLPQIADEERWQNQEMSSTILSTAYLFLPIAVKTGPKE